MKVQIRDDNKVVLDDLPERREFVFDPPEAVRFAQSVIEAACRCGYVVRVEAQVREPTDLQIAAAINRVGHMRRAAEDKPWNDVKVNSDIVMRVLEATR